LKAGEALFKDLMDWIEIPSVTGAEGDYGDALARRLEALGFDCERQDLAPGRFNLLARAGEPGVVFCTHLDTVPPYFGARQDSDFIYGRGSCDAKGQAVAMIEAGRQLLAAGLGNFGFLFTAGEEVDSAGAILANQLLAGPWRPHHVIVGEPTENEFIRGHKGLLYARLEAKGVAGHSSQDIGPSAVHELARCACRLLDESWGQHELFGAGTINIGQIEGGVAVNVVADRARAEILVRTVEEPELVLARLGALLGEHVEILGEVKAYAPVEFEVPPGAPQRVVAFGTDAPHLARWGTPLLFGPGAIIDAHTDGEKICKRELAMAVARHVESATAFLEEEAAE
jgi:acetylornithine deacetylase